MAAVPAVILGLGALTLPDSPNSLVFRGKVEQGRKVLEGYRGESWSCAVSGCHKVFGSSF